MANDRNTNSSMAWRGICLGCAITSIADAKASADEVDTAIVFAVDTSASIDQQTAHLQRAGHAEALRSRAVANAISSGPVGCIAVTYIHWSSAGHVQTVMPWKTLCTQDDASEAADVIDARGDRGSGRRVRGKTSLSFAIDVSSLILDKFSGHAARKIIDISSNGTNNDGLPVADSKSRAIAKGQIINGIAISDSKPGVTSDLPGYFAQNVIGGPGSFVVAPKEPADYAMAIRRKLVLEIGNADPLDAQAQAWSFGSRGEARLN